MIIAGIILIVLQVIGIIGSVIAGNNPFDGGLFGTIGYFFFGIIGIVLIIVGIKTKNKNSDTQTNTDNASTQDKINKPETEVKTNTITPLSKNSKSSTQKSIYGKREFELWLIDMGYKEYTPSGLPSAVYQYSKAVDLVVEIERLSSWKELEPNIDLFIKNYDIGGIKENIGNKSHRTVINALKRYKEFLMYN